MYIENFLVQAFFLCSIVFTQCTDHSGWGSGTNSMSLREMYEESLEENGHASSALSLPCQTPDFGHPLQS